MPSKAEIQALVETLVISRDDIAYTHPVFMQCFLPHRSLPKPIDFYQIDHGKASLAITAGRLINPQEPRVWEKQAIPAGAKARLLVAYINDQAIRSKSSVIDMGHSLRDFMDRNGIPVGGKNGHEITKQAKNLAAAEIMLGTWSAHEAHQQNFRIAKGLSFWIERNADQGTLWSPEMHLSDDYLQALLAFRVPVDFRALVALQANPRAMDIYCWLSYRLARLDKPTPIPFEALHPVFGPSVKQLKHFKHDFLTALKLALKYYPTARVAVEGQGITLRPSPPAIPRETGSGNGRRSVAAVKRPRELDAELNEARSFFLIDEAKAVACSPKLEPFLASAIPPLVAQGYRDQVLKIVREAKAEAKNPPGFILAGLRALLSDAGLKV